MGEAKRRGSKQDRIAETLGLKERSLSDVRKMLGLPESAEFCGYAIHLEESDEFLSEFEETRAITKKMWAKTPELAKLYDNFGEAYGNSRKCNGSTVVGVFDVGDQLVVANVIGSDE